MGLFRDKRVATVAFNLRPRSGPYGGGNQWADQLSTYLHRCGYRIVYHLDDSVDLVMGTHAGLGGTLRFSYEEVLEAKKRNPRLRCIQRINDNDLRKGTGGMDAQLAAANRAADHTVFVSDWLRDYHSTKWFESSKPHSVILNGADPAVFHPFGNNPWDGKNSFRVVTHHWSDNPSKGFDVYGQIDEAIEAGSLPGVELRIVGRWPREIHWKSAHTYAACARRRLAERLRECHVAVTASRHEPGAMHPVEALQCGLPLLYTSDSGGTVELGGRFGVLIGHDLVSSVREIQKRYSELRARVLREAPGGDTMCAAYRRLIQSILAGRS